MKTFEIPVRWEMYGAVEIEAGSLQEAIGIFDETIDDIKLPEEKNYVNNSFRREDEETVDMHNKMI